MPSRFNAFRPRRFSALGIGALAAILSLISLTPSLAEDGLACPGENLLQQLEKEDPALYKRALEQADAVPNGKTIFWKVEKPGIEPSWLFGTMHVSDPRVMDKPEGFSDAFHSIDTLALELAEITTPQKIALEVFKHPEMTTFQDGKTLDQILPPDATAELAAGLKRKGINMDLMAKMRPWFININLSTRSCEIRRKASGFEVLDESLALDALDEEIELVGLETPLEQITALASVPDATMLQNLRHLLALPNGTDDIVETMIDLYDHGNMGMLLSLDNVASKDPEAAEDFKTRVITNRNKVMAERAKPYLDKGRTMIAVGAAHLPGKDGLVELLRQQGFTLTAVN